MVRRRRPRCLSEHDVTRPQSQQGSHARFELLPWTCDGSRAGGVTNEEAHYPYGLDDRTDQLQPLSSPDLGQMNEGAGVLTAS
jgi:hypothetical protein